VIHIIAIVTAKPGRRAEALEAVRDVAPLARAETGCIEYSPLVDLDSSAAKFGTDSFVVVEKWKDKAALARHRTAAHMVAYAAKTQDLIAKRSIYLLGSAPTE
jgi:quinol monooxygenase YgiN